VRLLSSDTAANSQCVVSGVDSSFEAGATTATLSVRIQFKPAFAGTRKVYTNVWDRASVASGWSLVGALTVNQPPVVTGLTPANGSGSGDRLTFSLSDPNGGGDIMGVYIIINFIPSGANSCYLFYNGWNNSVYLADDQAAAFAQVRLGSGDTAQNTQCMVSGAASAAVINGSSLNLILDLTFKPVYNGQRNVFVVAYDLNASWSGLYQVGTYTVAGTNHAPAAVSVSPSSGSGATRTFRFTYQDEDGAGDIAAGMVLINASLDPANACMLYFAPILQGVALANDAANAWSANVRFGSADSASNSHCTVTGLGSSMTQSGNTVTLDVAITFRSGWTGTKQIHMLAWDWRSVSSGWQYRGLWTVP
jgi:hypothetical protein